MTRMADTQESVNQKLSQEIAAAKGRPEALARDIAEMHESGT
jgi:hypothetical protein